MDDREWFLMCLGPAVCCCGWVFADVIMSNTCPTASFWLLGHIDGLLYLNTHHNDSLFFYMSSLSINISVSKYTCVCPLSNPLPPVSFSVSSFYGNCSQTYLLWKMSTKTSCDNVGRCPHCPLFCQFSHKACEMNVILYTDCIIHQLLPV